MKIKHSKKGFTLVEALVAVSIVLVGVTAAFSVAQFGISSASSVRNRVSAAYLAQEGLEAVKNIKDSNLQKIAYDPTQEGRNWLEGISGHCSNANGCGYSIVGFGSFFTCGANNCSVTYVKGNFLQTQAVESGASGFVRRIYVTETVPGKEAEVLVTITRPGDDRFNTFELKSLIYSWF